MEIKLIDIEWMRDFIGNFEKNILPKLRKISNVEGDCLFINKMEIYFEESSLELKSNGFRMNFDFFNQYRKSKLLLGGFFIKRPNDVYAFNRRHNLNQNELLVKDVYFIYLFLIPLLNGLNYNAKMFYGNYDINMQFRISYYVGKTYTLVKGIKNELHNIYGNVYDFGLSKCESMLHGLAVKYNYDLRTPEQKFSDNAKSMGNGCLEIIMKIALALILFGGIGMCVNQCSH